MVKFPDDVQRTGAAGWTSVFLATALLGGSEPLSVSVQDASLLDVMGQQEPGDQVVALVLRVSASPPVFLYTGGSWLAGVCPRM